MQSPDKITDRAEGKPAGQTAISDQLSPEAAVNATDVPPVDADGFRTTPDQTNAGWPPGVPYIVGNEACERFSFYGMKTILQVHLTGLFALQAYVQAADKPTAVAESSATQIVHLFLAGVYAFPMIGALAADRWLGKYRIIFFLSLVYCVGQAVLAFAPMSLLGMFLGLALIAIGSGGIKPCVSANVGDQFGKANSFRVRTIFQIFYFSINFGSFFATILIPILRTKAGWWVLRASPGLAEGLEEAEVNALALRIGTSIAFALPGVLMFIATLIFWMGRRKFVHVPPKPGGQIGLLDTFCSVSLFLTVGHLFLTLDLIKNAFGAQHELLWMWKIVISTPISLAFLALGLFLFGLRQRIKPDDGFFAITLHTVAVHLGLRPAEASPHGLPHGGFWGPGFAKYGAATEGPIAVFKIISVFLLVSVFWALFDQHSSTWIRQAAMMDLRLWGGLSERFPFSWMGYTFDASQTPMMNPALVMIFIPLMNVAYGLLDKAGLKTTPLRRVTVGMVLTSLSFVATALLQAHIDGSEKGSVWIGWQLVQYAIITVGEVMVSVTGLEFAYTQAPKKMKSTVMGFWLLTVSLGNVLVTFLAGFKGLSLVNFFWVFAILSAAAAVLFGLRAAFYQAREFGEE
jgi:POT family proton-dependent oligopeptide transporter